MSEHVQRKVWHGDRDYSLVRGGCVNALGFNVTWERAEKAGHALPDYSELDEQIMDAFGSAPDLMGGLRAVYAMGQGA